MSTPDQFEKLRRALADLSKVQRWFVVGAPWGRGDYVVAGHQDPHLGRYVADTSDIDGEGVDVLENAAFIAAANPAAVRNLLAELDALRASKPPVIKQDPAAVAVPDGWKLVPVEPTQQMLDVGRWTGAGSVSVQEEWARKEVWQRMLAAAPQPPVAAQEPDEQREFVSWLDSTRPSGDVESVQYQWENSIEYAEFRDAKAEWDRTHPAPQPAPVAQGDAMPTIKGVSIGGGYVIVTPAGWGDDKAWAVRDAILRIFPVNSAYMPKPSEDAARAQAKEGANE